MHMCLILNEIDEPGKRDRILNLGHRGGYEQVRKLTAGVWWGEMVSEWIVRLTLPYVLRDRPIIYQLIRQFELLVNIREAHVNTESGWLTLSLQGEQQTIQRSIEWMVAQAILVEVLSREDETP
jgi:ABC-type methionine transport system ATPase subunit